MLEAARGSIETHDLTMVYRSGKMEVVALRDVNLRVDPGEFVAVMGPSGCGKSTLLHLLGGLARPTSGQVCIDGVNLAGLSDAERTEVRRKKVGYIFQRFNLLPTISARANIELAKRIHGNGHMNLYADDEIFSLLGISEKLGFRPTELSGGEQQRIAIARAVINQPSILLADEPTGNLDSRNSRQVLTLLQDLNQRLNQTLVMITHDPEAASMASRVIEMRDGQVLVRAHHFTYEPEFEGLF